MNNKQCFLIDFCLASIKLRLTCYQTSVLAKYRRYLTRLSLRKNCLNAQGGQMFRLRKTGLRPILRNKAIIFSKFGGRPGADKGFKFLQDVTRIGIKALFFKLRVRISQMHLMRHKKLFTNSKIRFRGGLRS